MRPIYFAISLVVLLAWSAAAQSVRGSIGGIVTDPSLRPIDAAAITLTEEATAKTRSAGTDTHGAFLISALPPGSYRLVVEHTGFRKYSQPLVLAVDQGLSLE